MGQNNIPQDTNELKKIIKQWSEGNPHLEEAIWQCIKNGVLTEASCAGHPKLHTDPYMAMEITDESRPNLYNVLNIIFKNRHKIKCIDFFNDTDKYGIPKSHVAIHPKYKHRNEIFDLISEGAKGKISLENCHPIVQRIIEIEQKAKQLELSLHDFSYRNFGHTLKSIILLNTTFQRNKLIYDRANIKNNLNICLTDSQIEKLLLSISTAMETIPKPTHTQNSWILTDEEKHSANERSSTPNLNIQNSRSISDEENIRN